ncbi:MAG: universal stress protein, partial [Nitrososphaeraceae archaeon]
IMGTRGRTGFKKLLLGSVASGVVTYSHCPVLVIYIRSADQFYNKMIQSC